EREVGEHHESHPSGRCRKRDRTASAPGRQELRGGLFRGLFRGSFTPQLALLLLLARLLLRADVRLLDERRAAAPAEDEADQGDCEEAVEGRGDQLLADGERRR